MLQWARANGCEWNANTWRRVATATVGHSSREPPIKKTDSDVFIGGFCAGLAAVLIYHRHHCHSAAKATPPTSRVPQASRNSAKVSSSK